MNPSRRTIVLSGAAACIGLALPAQPLVAGEPWADELLSRHNAKRAASKVGKLKANAKLTAAAQDYAKTLAKLGKLGHNLDGTPGSRIRAAGYAYSAWGENVASGYKTPAAVMKGWMNSPGHRSNILKARFTEVGFGRAVTKSGKVYWVADFGDPR